MTVISDLLEEGKYAEAISAFGLDLERQKLVVERIQQFAAANGQYEMTGYVDTHPYVQDNVVPETNMQIYVCTDRRSLRIILAREGNGYPYLDFNQQESDLRTCDYPTTCECEDDYDCSRCDYGSSYCIQHHTYH